MTKTIFVHRQYYPEVSRLLAASNPPFALCICLCHSLSFSLSFSSSWPRAFLCSSISISLEAPASRLLLILPLLLQSCSRPLPRAPLWSPLLHTTSSRPKSAHYSPSLAQCSLPDLGKQTEVFFQKVAMLQKLYCVPYF